MGDLIKILLRIIYIAFLFGIVLGIVLISNWLVGIFVSGWEYFPFGIVGLLLGIFIVAVTYFLSYVFADRKIYFSWDYLYKLNAFESVGYLFGLVLIIASIAWFFLPPSLINLLPSSGIATIFFILAILCIYEMGETISEGIISLRTSKTDFILYLLAAAFCFCFINIPVWSFTETLPTNYYLFGKIIFAFILFLQILYVFFFHIIPKLQIDKKIRE